MVLPDSWYSKSCTVFVISKIAQLWVATKNSRIASYL